MADRNRKEQTRSVSWPDVINQAVSILSLSLGSLRVSGVLLAKATFSTVLFCVILCVGCSS